LTKLKQYFEYCSFPYVFRVDATEAGVYKVCFDNTFSHFARKLVFFEIITGDDDDEDESDEKKDWKAAQEELASIVDMTVQDFKVRI
jgi:hypothetical protein